MAEAGTRRSCDSLGICLMFTSMTAVSALLFVAVNFRLPTPSLLQVAEVALSAMFSPVRLRNTDTASARLATAIERTSGCEASSTLPFVGS